MVGQGIRIAGTHFVFSSLGVEKFEQRCLPLLIAETAGLENRFGILENTALVMAQALDGIAISAEGLADLNFGLELRGLQLFLRLFRRVARRSDRRLISIPKWERKR